MEDSLWISAYSQKVSNGQIVITQRIASIDPFFPESCRETRLNLDFTMLQLGARSLVMFKIRRGVIITFHWPTGTGLLSPPFEIFLYTNGCDFYDGHGLVQNGNRRRGRLISSLGSCRFNAIRGRRSKFESRSFGFADPLFGGCQGALKPYT
jgi:hypothetical protein